VNPLNISVLVNIIKHRQQIKIQPRFGLEGFPQEFLLSSPNLILALASSDGLELWQPCY